ncbi:SRPBCC family protein [Nocardioides sp.]|uniref:SRPBCC family protein n=1 Tax=Nocardioides sp. TaxID=35761 RepID=UPI003511223F
MTFEHTETATTTADADAVWALWSDPATWATWDPPVQEVVLDGPFAEGATGTLTLAGPFAVPVRLEVVEPGRRYLDVLEMGELRIRIDHVLTPRAEGGCDLVVHTVIDGPGAADIGPMVTSEAPVALAALAAMAEGRPA